MSKKKKMIKEQKFTSLKLSKKIYELTQKKGIKLESKYCWLVYLNTSYMTVNNIKVKKPKLILRKDAKYILSSNKYYIPALDTAEWGEMMAMF